MAGGRFKIKISFKILSLSVCLVVCLAAARRRNVRQSRGANVRQSRGGKSANPRGADVRQSRRSSANYPPPVAASVF